MLAKKFETKEQDGSEETLLSGDVVEETEPVGESTEEVGGKLCLIKTNAAGVLLGATGCGLVLVQYFQIGPSPVLYKESDSSLIRVNESSWGALKPPR